MDTLHLDIVDFEEPNHWRFALQSQDRTFLAENAVAIDRADPHYRGFIGLPDYLEHYAVDRETRDEQERKLVDRLGAWIADTVFGPIAAKIVAHNPVVVRVAVPEAAEALLTLPFELAHAGGRPLALLDVSLVYEPPEAAVPPRPDGVRIEKPHKGAAEFVQPLFCDGGGKCILAPADVLR